MNTKYVRLVALTLAAVCWPILSVRGQSAENVLTDRLEQLESETKALRGELATLRAQQEQPVRLPQTVSMNMAPAAAPKADGLSMDAVRGEMKKFAWAKGDFKIIPYGSLWADMIYESQRTYPGPYTLWVPSEQTEGEDAFYIDARRTRLGLDVEGPRIPFFCCAKSSGRVEIDFMGDTALENKGAVLLRHAYWQVKDDCFALLVGQTWDVISPLYPGSLNYSVGWDGGNIGYRRAQFRAERYLHFSPEFLMILQGSLNQNVVPDFATTAGVDREATDWPIIEGRMATRLGPRGEGCLPMELGVSGHVGQTGYDFGPLAPPIADDVRLLTWSFNVDAMVPITPCLRFQGEFFTGDNLSAFLGGIQQGVDLVRRTGIRSTGGWIDLRYDWTPRLHSCVGYGVDDPNDNDITYGRTYNQFLFGNVTFDITKKFLTGFEVAFWRTLYQDTRVAPVVPQPTQPGESVVTQWMVQYSF